MISPKLIGPSLELLVILSLAIEAMELNQTVMRKAMKRMTKKRIPIVESTTLQRHLLKKILRPYELLSKPRNEETPLRVEKKRAVPREQTIRSCSSSIKFFLPASVQC
jgi:hypothetical protein